MGDGLKTCPECMNCYTSVDREMCFDCEKQEQVDNSDLSDLSHEWNVSNDSDLIIKKGGSND